MKTLLGKYPLSFSLILIIFIGVLSEALLMPFFHSLYSPSTGQIYGEYLTGISEQFLISFIIVVFAIFFGFIGKLGFKKPQSNYWILLSWPILLLACISGLETILQQKIVFNLQLFITLAFLYLSTGLIEELIFRGCIQGLLMKKYGKSYKGIITVVIVSNILFGVMHIYNFLSGRYTFLAFISQLIISIVFGIFFSALYIRSGSIIPGIIIHMIFDLIANLSRFAPDIKPRSEIVFHHTPEQILINIIIMIPILLISLFYLRKSKVKQYLASQ